MAGVDAERGEGAGKVRERGGRENIANASETGMLCALEGGGMGLGGLS